jgi:hypothetical protein
MKKFNNLLQARIIKLAGLAHSVERKKSGTKKSETIVSWYNEKNPLSDKFSELRHSMTYELFSNHLPNDWLEDCLLDLLQYMQEYTFKSAENAMDLSHEISQSQADIYNQDLYKWFYYNYNIDDYIDCQIADGLLEFKTVNQLFLEAQALALEYLTSSLIGFLLDNSNFPDAPELPE